MNKLGMENDSSSQEYWLKKLYRKSESTRTVKVAKVSLKTFDLFCKDQGYSRDQVIEQYQKWFNPKPKPDELVKPDIQSICSSLDMFVDFMSDDRKDIVISANIKTGKETTFKKKSPKTIVLYFGFIKSYLRICHGIKISVDDIADYVTFPKRRKEQRQPLTLKQLKAIMNNSNPKRKALYYVLVTSGMRLGEALSLTKKSIFFNENPVRIKIEAESTKTKGSRETYISSEAVEKLMPLLDDVINHKNDCSCNGCTKKFFMDSDNLGYHVSNEDRLFGYLREKLGMTEKYPNSVRYVVNIHTFRSYFHTKASQKHSTEYANALDGHEGYLEQYYRLDPKKHAEMYKELEPSLLIESVQVEADTTKDQIIKTLQEDMLKLKEQFERKMLIDA